MCGQVERYRPLCCGPGGRGFESRRSPLVKSLVSADSAGNRTGRSSATGTDTGTDARASTSGNAVEGGGDEPPIRFRGDELDLYGEFHVELTKTVASRVHASWEVVEDSCSFAWVEFFR